MCLAPSRLAYFNMANSLVFSGLEELRTALRNLPAELAADASQIVQRRAENVATSVKAAYPSRTGNLRAGVKLTHVDQGKYSAGVIVKSSAKHAWLYEYGSETRTYTTIHGVKHPTGKMPPRPTFVPIVQRQRRAMWEDLAGLLREHGLLVTGTP